MYVYVFQPSMYQDVNKRNPKIDFIITALLAMFWLAGAAAWANGLTGLRWAVNTENWLDHSSICKSVHMSFNSQDCVLMNPLTGGP